MKKTMPIIAIKERRWRIDYTEDVEVVEASEGTHYIIGDVPKFKGTNVDMKVLSSAAAGSPYGYVAFSITKDGRLIVTTDIVGSIPVYVVGKRIITTNYLTAIKFGKPEIMDHACVYDIEHNKGLKYYSFRTANMLFTESNIGYELESYLYREIGGKRIAVAFSGGVDSAILAVLASKFAIIKLFTLGLKDSYDIAMARSIAKELNIWWVPITVSEEEVYDAIPTVINSVPCRTQMDISLAVGFYLLGKRVKSYGFKGIILGQLADELFAGYKKYEMVPVEKLNEMILHDVEKSYLGLARDVAAFQISGICPVLPYAKKRIVNLGLKTSPNLKIKDGMRKYILRKLAEKLGLPEQVIRGPKKAFQYGSGIDRLVRKWMKSHKASSAPYSP